MRRALLIILALVVHAVPAAAQITNFSRDVNSSIDLGLAWLDQAGAFRNPSASGNAAGLTALALLEKRESADLRSHPRGYRNALPADRNRLDQVMPFIIARSRNAGFYAYRDGADTMAMAVYLLTGGPDQAGALASIRATFDRMINNQGGHGYWCYSNGGCQDSSTTQLTMAGLAAARAVFINPGFRDDARVQRLNVAVARNCQRYASAARAICTPTNAATATTRLRAQLASRPPGAVVPDHRGRRHQQRLRPGLPAVAVQPLPLR
ncbi:MAG: hypothetical protein R3F43_28145 [bacterium]